MDFRRKPDFTRLINTLNGKGAESIPLIELGVHPVVKEKILNRPVRSLKDEIEFSRLLGYDFIKLQPELKFDVGGHKMEGTGDSPDRTWAPEKSGLISNRDDLEKFEFPKPEEISYKRFEQAAALIPDDMCIIGQYGDIFTMAWELVGFENFAIATYTDSEFAGEVTDKIASIVLKMFEEMSEFDNVKAMWYSDDIAYTSGLMLQPDFFKESLFPHISRIGGICASKGIPFIYHSDGLLYDVIDDLIESGVRALHPIEPKSMDINELNDKYGERLSLCGGIDLDLLSRGTEKEVENLVLDLVENLGQSGKWCAGSSNSIPEYVKLENYLTMQRLIIENGQL